MLFSRLIVTRTCKLLKFNNSLPYNKNPASYLMICNNYLPISTTNQFSTNSKQTNSYTIFNKRNIILLVTSTTLLGLYKLYENEVLNNEWKPRLLDAIKSWFHFQNLQAKEDKDDKNEKTLVITPRQKLFFQFASVEYEGIPYMTPQDFLESVTEDHARPRMRRKLVTEEMVQSYLKNTPGRGYGSKKLFRNLEEKGLISYSEYLFLLCVITKPKSNFRIAFNMFDTDGNHRVDKNEFLVVTQIYQRDSELKNNVPVKANEDNKLESKNKLMNSLTAINDENYVDTTILVHFFGPKGKKQLEFNDFIKFSDDLQREVLEIEFNEFSKGMNKISSIEFAEILLRYTKFSREKKFAIIKRLNQDPDSHQNVISFEKFHEFSMFMNNLDDFSLALKFHTQANRSISTNEFQRAVRISSGFTLDEHIVKVIFNVFDENSDGQLSYKEFISVLRSRLRRGLKSSGKASFATNNYTNANDLTQSDLLNTNDERPSLLTTFRNCVKRKLKKNAYD